MTREEAIEVLKANYPSKCFEQLREAVDIAVKALEQEPKERTGEWQQDMDGTFLCSECGSGYKDQPTLMGKPMFAFCPICGCRMIKGTDE